MKTFEYFFVEYYITSTHTIKKLFENNSKHETKDLNFPNEVDYLNKLGNEGWEIINYTHNIITDSTKIIFKREKK